MCNSIVSVIVTDNAPVNCSTISLLFLITVLEVSIVSVIVTDNAPVNCSTISLLFLITVLEVFAKVNVTPPPF